MRLLFHGMVLVILISISSLVLYSLLLWVVAPTTPGPNRLTTARLRKNDEYITLVGSDIESHFYTLEVHNCSLQATGVNITWNNAIWQKVDGRRVYLYRSYYDIRYAFGGTSYHYVRILGMSQGKIKEEDHYYCHLWYPREQDPVAVRADVSEVWQPVWDSKPKPDIYHTYLFSCPVPLRVHGHRPYPEFVSLSYRACENMTTQLKVHHDGIKAWQRNERKGKYIVCVKGMNFEEDVSVKLIEWLEMIFILGADKILIYKYTVHPNVAKVLDYYHSKGKVMAVPLTLPGDQPNEPKQRTRYLKKALWQKRRNELIPYNDCLYRNIYLYDYIVPLDVDEVIIPVGSHTWSQMFTKLQRKQPKALEKYASFSAQNAYFFDVFNVTSDPEIPYYFHMLRHTIRSANFSIHGHSVKSFISTKNSLTVFNHYTLESLYPRLKRNLVMNTSLAQINHYKKRCPREMYSQCKSKFLVYTKKDNIIKKYKDKLMPRVELVISDLSLLV
ncbi:uncharacterized protein LOC123508206 [Portunus trituberculatus]|uniref:uncharacterized protein LOC123508206 n=1 Tax=Portunus trituberculatus TaxID=210409 RepID=UPI001E1D11F1|nr:uncharacterized protein LOC123508206 [Portunus trituberculatus]XP_045117675.1 uncharacterized protein LOC123508206 [Portunus trituberculatus]XP_045117676.1 uncharacterized protein LOC123508206 [Portunus trituberculatus]